MSDSGDATLAPSTSSTLLAYERIGAKIVRTTTLGVRQYIHTLPDATPDIEPEKAWHLARLKGAIPDAPRSPEGALRIVDLFCGSGGLSLGAHWAVQAIGKRARTTLAADLDAAALDVFAYNLDPRRVYQGSVRELLRHEPLTQGDDPAAVPPEAVVLADWPSSVGRADIVVGGPPCQGHSNLNNRTRRSDPRNELYLWMAAAAHATQARLLVVENVPTVEVDAGDVVERTRTTLGALGYRIGFDGILSADDFGVAQARKRHFLIAVRGEGVDERAIAAARDWLATRHGPTATLLDAIGDLQDLEGTEDYDLPSQLSEENGERVRWLHDRDAYDLENALRPASHRDGHTYPSIYGRMYADRPAQTLTTGFLTPGRGRYVHPTRPRTLTPHEGARIQGFPDDFRFVGRSGAVPKRTQITRMIGDAVPPSLAFHVVLAGLWMAGVK